MKKFAIQLVVTAILLTGCGDGADEIVTVTPTATPAVSPSEAPTPNPAATSSTDGVTSASPKMSDTQVDNENPIDRHITFQNASNTVEMNAVSNYYLESWIEELNNVANKLGKSDVVSKVADRADFVAKEEGEKWGDGTGRTAAELIARAGIYKLATYSMISELKAKGETYEYIFAYEYKPLLDSFMNSQALHYNVFEDAPDSTTAHLTMYSFVALGKQMPGQDKMPSDLKELKISEVANGDNVIKTSPGNLYKNSFLNGSYTQPPAGLNGIMKESQDGLVYSVSEPTVYGTYEILQAENQGDVIKVTVSLSRADTSQGNSRPVMIGVGTVEFKKSTDALCKYTIQSYKADYDKFDDVL